MKLTCILLGGGASSRFRGNKLLETLGTKKILQHTIDKLNQLDLYQIILVTHPKIWEAITNKEKITHVFHECPEKGISYSIRCGLEKSKPCDGFLFMVGDQPLLSDETLNQLLSTYEKDIHTIIGVGKNQQLMNPVIFPEQYKNQLMCLPQNKGGKWLIQQHNLDYKIIEAKDEKEVWDIDTQDDLMKLKERHNGFTQT